MMPRFLALCASTVTLAFGAAWYDLPVLSALAGLALVATIDAARRLS